VGGIWTSGRSITEWVAEMVGLRAGLAISEQDVARSMARTGYPDWYPGVSEEVTRVRSEVVEIAAYSAMDAYCVPGAMRATAPLHLAVGKVIGDRELARSASEFIVQQMRAQDPQPRRHSLFSLGLLRSTDIASELGAVMVAEARAAYGDQLACAVEATLREITFRESLNPWRWTQTVDWGGRLALSELFESDSTLAVHGRFFDQRFINYLVCSFEEIGAIHWRKFEAMVAEYFHRSGFQVELGPGRNDNGVDIRIWESSHEPGESPVTIIQCKRERRKITKVVVKALAADVQWEGAKEGLLVATTDWSPGAREVVRTRSYPLREIDPPMLRSWLAHMHDPSSGVWLPA
jgi:restriction system protein